MLTASGVEIISSDLDLPESETIEVLISLSNGARFVTYAIYGDLDVYFVNGTATNIILLMLVMKLLFYHMHW